MNLKVFFFLGLASLILIIAGSVSPGWIRTRGFDDDVAVDIGIWYFCVEGNCGTTVDFSNEVGTDGALGLKFLEFQIETTVAIVLGVIALILLHLFNRQGSDRKKLYRVLSAVGFQVSGTLVWVAVGKFIHYHVTRDWEGSWVVAYSLILAGIGGTIAIIVAIMMHILGCQESKRGRVV